MPDRLTLTLMQEFDIYLEEKKIDSKAFRTKEASKYEEFKKVFDQVSPASFTQHKLFVINSIRRKYPLKVEKESSPAKPKKLKPNIKPKFGS